jgi:hypothetical protein
MNDQPTAPKEAKDKSFARHWRCGGGAPKLMRVVTRAPQNQTNKNHIKPLSLVHG